MTKLEIYLEENITLFKNFSKYDNFIINFPNILLQIDQSSIYDLVNAYYPNIYNRLFEIIDSTFDLKECIINYVTSTQTIEIVDANIKTTSTIKNYDLINCDCEGIFENCFFVGSNIKKSQLTKCKLQQSDATESKILNCKIESSDLNNCFFMDGYLNSDMYGGVYRSGKLGPYATLDSNVKIVTDNGNFFDTKFNSEIKGETKGIIKALNYDYGKK
jgi:uncharacterized protein YjbI with pentapeptide repeats